MHLHSEMMEWTEWPGALLPLDTHRVIHHRYHWAAEFCIKKDVLEIGCGSGVGLNHLGESARSVVGLEYSRENIKKLASNGKLKYSVVNGDAENLPFASSSFDIVVALAMVYYLDMDRFLRNVQRVLRPGGTLLFCMSNKDVPGFVAAPHTTRYYSIPEVNEILGDYGFQATYTGAFAYSNKPLVWLLLRAFVKGVAKKIVYSLPNGSNHWEKLRKPTLGEFAPFPDKISSQVVDTVSTVKLASDRVNRRYRVIYVEAKIRDDVIA